MTTRKGSTRRWRRIRFLVLGRDATACQFPAAEGPPPTPGSWAYARGIEAICGRYATHVDHAEEVRNGAPLDLVVDLDDLRASCAPHNLGKGARPASEYDLDQAAAASPAPASTRWSW